MQNPGGLIRRLKKTLPPTKELIKSISIRDIIEELIKNYKNGINS